MGNGVGTGTWNAALGGVRSAVFGHAAPWRLAECEMVTKKRLSALPQRRNHWRGIRERNNGF